MIAILLPSRIRVAAAIALVCLGCDSKQPPHADTGGSAAAAKELKDDRHSPTFQAQSITKIMQDNYEERQREFVEAKLWLGEANHVPGQLAKATAEKLVADLYAAGALKVFAADFKPDGDKTVAESFYALVPATNDAVRSKVEAVRANHYRTYLPTVGKSELVGPLTKADAVAAVVVIDLKH